MNAIALHGLDPPRLARTEPVLAARGLALSYGATRALDGVDIEVLPGEILGVVGESGSGKSTLMRILNLEEAPDAGSYALQLEDGEPRRPVLGLARFERRMLRARHIGIVYQNPHLGLRMRHSSSGNVAERLLVAGERSFAALRARAGAALESSEFPMDRFDARASTLSGGMQQRVQLAKAIALRPRLLLLDEPTTGLDVSVQAAVLDTLRRLQVERSLAIVLVSHDLGVIRTLADRVQVMRHGRVVEQGLTDQVLGDPQHAYTQLLVHAKL